MKTTLSTLILSLIAVILASQNVNAQANTELSNLVSPTKVNVSLLPGTTNSKNLGSANKAWKEIYLRDIYSTGSFYLDGAKFLDNSGTNNTFVGATGNTANTGTANTFVGFNAGPFNTTGSGNSFLGTGAGFYNTTGGGNSFYGNQSGYSNTTGGSNSFYGDHSGFANTTGILNSFFGQGSGQSNTIGSNNSFVGHSAGLNNTTGNENTFMGKAAGSFNTAGYGNSFFGYNAGYANMESYNTASGWSALYSNTTGYSNSASGSSALYSNTTGHDNVANGASALYSNTTGFYNVANGASALYSNTTGYNNTASGSRALENNIGGNYNTAFGYAALLLNTTGYMNTAVGELALVSNETGILNVAIGRSALYRNTGSENTATGAYALYSNTTGYYNTANGRSALAFNTTGHSHVAIGYNSLHINTTGYANTAVGTEALYSITTQSGNTAIGYQAGKLYATLNGTFIGTYASANADGYSNSSCFGYSSTITAPNQVRIGDANVSSIGGYAGWTTLPSDRRFKKDIQNNVPGLEFIIRLKPVTYKLDVDAIDAVLNVNRIGEAGNQRFTAEDNVAKRSKSQIRYTGFIAQEVEQAAKEMSYDFSGIDAPKNDNDLYGLRYAEFVVPLVKAVQELDSINDLKDEEIKTLQRDVNDLKRIVAQLLTATENPEKSELKIGITPTDSYLGQNIPNPFDNSTTISFRIPSECKTAELQIIENATGRMAKIIPVTGNQSEVSIAAGTLATGSYSYSLIVDGKTIGTKVMILTK